MSLPRTVSGSHPRNDSRARRLLVMASMLASSACSNGMQPVDASVRDAVVTTTDVSTDSNAIDTRASDTGGNDSGASDSGTTDVPVPAIDSDLADVIGGDTAVRDTGLVDSGRVDSGSPDAGPPGVRFIGRYDHSNPMLARSAWSGSAVEARFTGTSLVLRMRSPASNVFEVVIDGGPPTVVHALAATERYTLATGLAAGTHSVLVYRRTEAFFGPADFIAFEPGGGGVLLSPPSAPLRRIEVVGDSITAGYGNEGPNATCPFTPETENHYLSYSSIAARALGADLISTAWSGIGMYRNYGGATTGTMPEYYPRTLPETATSAWDFASWIPHAVVINLGTNDFARGDPGRPFVDAYLAFARRVRGNYPSAEIFVALGPLLSGTPLTTARGYLDTVISTLRSAGDTRIRLLEFPTQTAANGIGCDYHPSLATHRMMATQLTATLRTALGW